MLLLEFNLDDLIDLSDEEINQGDDLSPTINRLNTASFIQNHVIIYKENTFYNSGIFQFKVIGRRPNAYGSDENGLRYVRDKSRVGTKSEHIIQIRPKTEMKSIDDLATVEVDLSCTCKDFQYVFMNMAYRGYRRGFGGKIQEYGLVPVSGSGRYGEDANIRNPDHMGALCKHALLVADTLLSASDSYILKKMDADIQDRAGTIEVKGVTTERPGEGELIQFEDKFYDRNGKLKHKSKIKKARDKKIQQIIELIKDTEYSGLPSYRGNFASSFEDFKKNMLQILVDFDAYYINKAEEEGVDETKYLPDDYQDSYDDLDFDLDRAYSVIDYSTDFDDNVINYALKDMDDESIDDLDAYLKKVLSTDFDIDKLIGSDFEDDISKLIGENKYIKNYKSFDEKD